MEAYLAGELSLDLAREEYASVEDAQRIDVLERKVGQLIWELDFTKRWLTAAPGTSNARSLTISGAAAALGDNVA